ncbi:hypothetical protein UFOVP607_36 [uncultured Caudovirales phage]|uniref:Uncharacterized protein n=1 Tax=uncultured Caudovirales phage TaxID=2100421 RepID=A0A6J5N3A4_9CAUD|nr:hypothetical protein UFOVP607_36 [uncultured Caudovirales phage]
MTKKEAISYLKCFITWSSCATAKHPVTKGQCEKAVEAIKTLEVAA